MRILSEVDNLKTEILLVIDIHFKNERIIENGSRKAAAITQIISEALQNRTHETKSSIRGIIRRRIIL